MIEHHLLFLCICDHCKLHKKSKSDHDHSNSFELFEINTHFPYFENAFNNYGTYRTQFKIKIHLMKLLSTNRTMYT